MLPPIHLKVVRVSALLLCLVISSACWWGRDRRDAHYGDRRDGHEDRHEGHDEHR